MPSPFAPASARLASFLIDLAAQFSAQLGGGMLGGVLAVLLTDAARGQKAAHQAAGSGVILGVVFWGIVAWFLNHGVLQGMGGATAGKIACGIRVVGRDGHPPGILRSLMRSCCYSLSLIPFGLGFAALLWDRASRSWHDRLFGTTVVRKSAIKNHAPALILGLRSTGIDRAA